MSGRGIGGLSCWHVAETDMCEETRVTVGGKGFLVEANTGRPTRVPIPNIWFKAVGGDTNGAYALC